MKRLSIYLLALCAGLLLAPRPAAAKNPAPGEGYVQVKGGRVWYRVVGTGPGTPLLLLHGGPGIPSYYLKPLAALGGDRPVVFYDQLGCGRSDVPADTSLWRMERFIDELATVRRTLGLEDVHIFGHSWGTMLAVDYMLTHPNGVHSLILAGPSLSIPRWVHDADSLLTTMPDSIQAIVARHEKDGTTDASEYQAAMMDYYHRYVLRRDPWPAEMDSCFAQMGVGVYTYMGGASEFSLTGTLKGYDRADRLKEIKVPTLFTAGRFDEATPGTTAFYQSLMPGSRLVIFDQSAHLSMLDEPEHYVEVLRDFLRGVDKKR